jgi:CheY-like chemotaxis protein
MEAVISYILMPRMDGYRLCQEVRKREEFDRVPFVFYTSTYTPPSDEQVAMDLGADKLVRKPAPPRELVEALQDVFKHPAHRRPREGAPPTRIGCNEFRAPEKRCEYPQGA